MKFTFVRLGFACSVDTILFLIFICFSFSLLNGNSTIQMPNCENILPAAAYGSLASLSSICTKKLIVSSGYGILLAAKRLFVQSFPHRHHFSWQTLGSKQILHIFLSIRESMIYTSLLYSQAALQVFSFYG